jgi:PAS domain-containing protein
LKRPSERYLSEENCHHIVETAQESIWVLDRNFRVLQAHEGIAEVLGYLPREIRGRLITDLFMRVISLTPSIRLPCVSRDKMPAINKGKGPGFRILVLAIPVFNHGESEGDLRR